MPPKASTETPAPAVNRKKQKRREKQAARLAEEQIAATSLATLGHPNISNGSPQYDVSGLPISENVRRYANGFAQGNPNYDEYPPQESDEQYYTEDDHPLLDRHYQYTNGYSAESGIAVNGEDFRAKRKKRGKSNPPLLEASMGDPIQRAHQRAYAPPPPPPPSLPHGVPDHGPGISKERIWNTSTGEERERIKEFWLSLGEEERRALVKIEKEAVLRKMKEQQKTSCSCTVCGRKRVAIEEELEVLYDAYYEELESYANREQVTSEDGTPVMPPTRGYATSVSRAGPWNQKRQPERRIQEVIDGEDEDDEDEYSDDEDDDDYSDDEPLHGNYGPANDFFNFGNSLTVQGGILTVADDLLKNDGKRFIDMMEQLAERRMQREEQAAYNAAMGQSSVQTHNHAPPVDDEQFDDEEDEEDYDSAEDDDEEFEDEMDHLTEDQRMEEGRRMFQIFAARMFEQRVLTAYKEKVAQERQQKLIEELDEESRLDKTREAKKAKEAQKKKEKKRMQKQAKDEERQRKEAEKAAEEASRKAVEEKKLEEQRQKKEEQRRKREAEKKAQDEERQRKEAEKQKRLQEVREQQAEQERKQREQRERDKKKKDELRKKEREEKEAREREAVEKMEQEAEEQRQREAKAKGEQELQERRASEEQAVKRKSKTAPVNHPVLRTEASASNLHPPAKSSSSNRSSPHLPVAVPVVPKAPTPVRPPLNTYQSTQATLKTSTVTSSGLTTSPPSARSPPSNLVKPLSIDTHTQARLPQSNYHTPFSPVALLSGHPSQPPGLVGPSQGLAGFTSNMPPMAPPGMPRIPNQQSPYNTHHSFGRNQYQNFGVIGAGGSNPPMQPTSRAGSLPISQAPIQAPIGPMHTASTKSGVNFSQQRENVSNHPRYSRHARQISASSYPQNVNTVLTSTGTQPIARPAPIQRPSSVAPSQQKRFSAIKNDVDDLSVHLGSSALLDDSDVPLAKTSQSRRNSIAPGEARRPTLTNHPFNTNSIAHPTQANHIWGPPPTPPSSSTLSTPLSTAFGADGRPLASQGFPQVLCDSARKLICGICQTLNGVKLAQNMPHDGWHDLMRIHEAFYNQWPQNMPTFDARQFLQLCEMDGNDQNGGGKFELVYDGRSKDWHFNLSDVIIKYEPIPPGLWRAPGGDVRSTTNTDLQSPRMSNVPPGLTNVRSTR